MMLHMIICIYMLMLMLNFITCVYVYVYAYVDVDMDDGRGEFMRRGNCSGVHSDPPARTTSKIGLVTAQHAPYGYFALLNRIKRLDLESIPLL